MRISDWSSDVCSSDLAWDPAAAYISIGQDDPGYRNWYMAADSHAVQVKAFNAYLVSAGVGGIVRIGRAWCRERGCQDVKIWVVAVSLKKKQNQINRCTNKEQHYEQ